MAELNLSRVEMPRQDPLIRSQNFLEVALGYSATEALSEAARCIQCPKHPCTGGCPVGVDIPDFIKALRELDLASSSRILKNKNKLPGICGRVCPQETQCEQSCVLARRGAPVAIGRLERYVADWERRQDALELPLRLPPTGQKVAVVGSGPAGLTCAADLAVAGHAVTVFEALHVPGGVLMYGIPEFRLPKAIVRHEVDSIMALGVEVRLDWVVGNILAVDKLFALGYQAVFLGTGAGLPMFMNVPGEIFSGIYSANEFLTRVNLMHAGEPGYDTPLPMGSQVAVIGGGNVAMDAARCALRAGAERVFIVYRRTKAEAPARAEELENAEEEGVVFCGLTNPVRFLANARGWVTAMECLKMELGEPDAKGRRRPIPKPGSNFIMDVDTVVIALGTTPNPLVPATTPGLDIHPEGTIIVDKEGHTTKPGVWAGGDAATGAATVISAMGAGRTAASSINAYLKDPSDWPAIDQTG
ncbi:MAG: NADPH-dependent glutamate synthase [Dehalococcoidia bacterium]|nr:NADPH-dependent glutamate synthase [Dehalococcoidia bacterium]